MMMRLGVMATAALARTFTPRLVLSLQGLDSRSMS